MNEKLVVLEKFQCAVWTRRLKFFFYLFCGMGYWQENYYKRGNIIFLLMFSSKQYTNKMVQNSSSFFQILSPEWKPCMATYRGLLSNANFFSANFISVILQNFPSIPCLSVFWANCSFTASFGLNIYLMQFWRMRIF